MIVTVFGMCKKSLIAFLGCYLVVVGSAYAQWVDLNASAGENNVELIWTTTEWPRELTGFNVKKREVGQTRWTTLNQSPISPEITVSKNWSNLGLNPSQESTIKNKLASYLKEGKLVENNKEDLLLLFRQTGGLKSGDRIKLKKDFDMALMLSFGYIDNTYKKGQNLEYGLFFVDLRGNEKEEPLDVYKLSDASFDLAVNFQRPAQGVTIQVSALKEKISKSGLWGFNIYKAERKDTRLLKKIGYSSFTDKGDKLEWEFLDETADNTKNHTYVIAAINSLQKETQRVTKVYEADQFEPVPLPEVIGVSLVDEIDVKVAWKTTLTKKQQERIKSVVVERLDPDDQNFEVIVKDLPLSSTQIVDKGLKLFDRVYVYRVSLVDTQGKSWYSQQASIKYQGKLLPGKPKNVKASVQRDGLTNYVVLSWDKANDTDTLTNGYYVYTDEQQQGKFMLESTPVIKANTYKHKVYGPEGRTYSFRVVGLTRDLDEGPYSEVSAMLGNSRLPEVANLKMETLPDKTIKLSWEYPVVADLVGFKVLMNGQPIGAGDTLDISQKSFHVIEPVAYENEMARFQVLAISKSGVGKSPERSILVSERKSDKKIPPPDGLRVKLVREKGKQYAQLTWEKVDQKTAGIKGYVIYTDAVKEGDIQRLNIDLINGNEYRYELPDNKKRQKYTFRVGVMAQDRTVVSFSEISLDRSKNKNSEDK